MGLLTMSLQAGCLILAVALLRAAALHRLPKGVFPLLWGVALARLLLPGSLPAPAFLDQWSGLLPWGVDTAGLVAPFPRGSAGVPGPVGPLPQGSTVLTPAGEVPVTLSVTPQGVERLLAAPLLPWIWAVGAGAVLLAFAVAYGKGRRALRFAWPVQGDEWLERWLARHPLRRPLRVLWCDRLVTPLAAGCLRPRILLPAAMGLEERPLVEHVLTHEYCHIRRWDALWKLLMTAALCLHWFNPLVWWMAALFCRDLEITCDEMVLRRLGRAKRAAYAGSLIGLAEQQSRPLVLHSGFSRNAVEERVVAIMKFKKASMAALVCGALLAAGSLSVFALGGRSQSTSGLAGTGAFGGEVEIQLAQLDTEHAQYQVTAVQQTAGAPEFEFYLPGAGIAKMELYSENELLTVLDWSGTQHSTYAEESLVEDFGGTLYAKKITLEFEEGFSAYDKIWYRWWGYNLNEWARQDEAQRILQGPSLSPEQFAALSESQRLALAAGVDDQGQQTGWGNIQLAGYPEELRQDTVTIVFTDRQGHTATRQLHIRLENDDLGRLRVVASLV